VIEHSHDDGEPSGTAGRPALAVLRGSGLGDAVVVVTRYFGGTKLGKGGLVRAYGDAVRKVLEEAPQAQKIATDRVETVIPYPFFERVRLLVAELDGLMIRESFEVDVTVTAQFPSDRTQEFLSRVKDLAHGNALASIVSHDPDTIIPIR
jgi:putative IMPACT (imprinted ancient) family translation regulator